MAGTFQDRMQMAHGHVSSSWEQAQGWLHQAPAVQVNKEAHPTKMFIEVLEGLVRGFLNIFVNILADPMKSCMELLVMGFFLVLLWLVCYHWDRVCYLITGDKNLHVDHLDVLARLLHYPCGSGEWTRWLNPCCGGHNLVIRLGQCMGILSSPVRISNIIVGDLPCVGRHNFYVCVECKTDPEMVTSVQEMKLPKVVHFSETLVVRLRRNLTEHRVRITVRSMKPVGHSVLCEAYFNATTLLELCDANQGILRFEMRPVSGLEGETPPWISLKFCYPKTAVEEKIEDTPSGLLTTYFDRTARLVWNEEAAELGMTVADFKDTYPICDTDGYEKVDSEPLESDIKTLYCFRAGVSLLVTCMLRVGFWGLLIFSLLRSYVRTCYKHYGLYAKAIAGNQTWHNITVPFVDEELKQVEEYCSERISCGEAEGLWEARRAEALWRPDSAEYSHCCPSNETIAQVCENPPGGQRPLFLRALVLDTIGQDIGNSGLECRAFACDWAQSWTVKHDGLAVAAACGLVVLAVLTQCMFNVCMRQCKRTCLDRKPVHHRGNAVYKEVLRRSPKGAASPGTASLGPQDGAPQVSCIGCAVM